MDDDRCRLMWKNGEDVTKWILRVETYAAARGWTNNNNCYISTLWRNVVKHGKYSLAKFANLYIFVLREEKVTILQLKLSQKW